MEVDDCYYCFYCLEDIPVDESLGDESLGDESLGDEGYLRVDSEAGGCYGLFLMPFLTLEMSIALNAHCTQSRLVLLPS
jgi:hypothetical protein